jgi:L-malate glycosyltransferase
VARWAQYCLELGYRVFHIKRQPGDTVPGVEDLLLPQPCPQFTPAQIAPELEILQYVPNNLIRDKTAYAMRLKSYRDILRKISPHIVHAHWLNNHGLNGLLASQGIAPFVQSVWGSDVFITPMLLERNFNELRFVLSRAQMVLGNSRTLLDTALSFLDEKPRTSVFKWGIKPYFDPRRYDKTQLRNTYRYAAEDVIVLSARGFKPIYNIRTVIGAFKQARVKYPQLKLILLGRGYGWEDFAFKENEGIRVMDSTTHLKTAELMALSDISISIPYSDSMANTLVESLAMNLYLIASELQPIKEYIKHDLHAKLVNPADVSAVARAIEAYFEDSRTREKFKKENLVILEHFKDEKSLRNVKAIYEAVL